MNKKKIVSFGIGALILTSAVIGSFHFKHKEKPKDDLFTLDLPAPSPKVDTQPTAIEPTPDPKQASAIPTPAAVDIPKADDPKPTVQEPAKTSPPVPAKPVAKPVHKSAQVQAKLILKQIDGTPAAATPPSQQPKPKAWYE